MLSNWMWKSLNEVWSIRVDFNRWHEGISICTSIDYHGAENRILKSVEYYPVYLEWKTKLVIFDERALRLQWYCRLTRFHTRKLLLTFSLRIIGCHYAMIIEYTDKLYLATQQYGWLKLPCFWRNRWNQFSSNNKIQEQSFAIVPMFLSTSNDFLIPFIIFQ